MRHFLIPARGGSKGVADKNVRDLGGRPILAWTVEVANKVAGTALPVILNSDDQKILDIAEGFGATPYKRPEYLAGDDTTMNDVVKEYFKNSDADEVVLLFPCCPFRTAETLTRAIQMYEFRGADSLMSVTATKSRPFGGVQIVDGRLHFQEEAEAFYRKQDTPAIYHATGSIFIIKKEELPNLNTQLFNKDTMPFVMEGAEAIDIETEYDLRMAQAMVNDGMIGSRRTAVVHA